MSDKPLKLTVMKGAVRREGFEQVKRYEVIDFQEPFYDDGKPIYFGALIKDRIVKFEEEREKNSYDYKLPESLIRSKSKVFEYALCNRFEYFVTLTIDEKMHDRYDLRAYKKKLGKFLNNYKQRSGSDIKYVLIPEFHQDGAVHMHGLVSGIPSADLIKNEYGYLDWTPYSKRFGYFSCTPIRDYERCAKYITKYITKDLQNLPKGSQVFMCSKGLNTAEILEKGFDLSVKINEPDYENEYVKVVWMNE